MILDHVKAAEARRAQIEHVRQNYKLDWLDAIYWEKLAQNRAIRLPSWYARTTPNAVSKWLKRLKSTDTKTEYGCTARRLIELNPRTPLRAFVGQMLEP